MRWPVMMMFVTLAMAMILAIIVMFYASRKRKCDYYNNNNSIEYSFHVISFINHYFKIIPLVPFMPHHKPVNMGTAFPTYVYWNIIYELVHGKGEHLLSDNSYTTLDINYIIHTFCSSLSWWLMARKMTVRDSYTINQDNLSRFSGSFPKFFLSTGHNGGGALYQTAYF